MQRQMMINVSNISTSGQHCICLANYPDPSNEEVLWANDAAWVLSNTMRVLGLQTGLGMLEAGMVSSKNIANIMVKNLIDVSVGGFTYWSIGYALSFGKPSNAFCGFGDFFFNAEGLPDMGTQYTKFFYHFAWAAGSTTIISGAIAERMKMSAFILFSAVNIIIYAIPACWVWNDTGFLKLLGFFDFAGGAVVHMSGGASALVAAIMLGPRLSRFAEESKKDSSVSPISSPITALTGTLTLWFAWFAFNCGSTFGIHYDLWRIAAKIAVMTANGSIGGSLAGLILTVLINRNEVYYDITYLITALLAGLVAITAGCSVFGPAESCFIGFVGGAIAIGGLHVLAKLQVDDPVGAVPIHFLAGFWSVIAAGLFGKNQFDLLNGHNGVLFGGGFYFLGIQFLGAVVITIWSMCATFLGFLVLKITIEIRMKKRDEILGADWVEHKVRAESLVHTLEKALTRMNLLTAEEKAVAESVAAELEKSKKEIRIIGSNIRIFPEPEMPRAYEFEKVKRHSKVSLAKSLEERNSQTSKKVVHQETDLANFPAAPSS